MTNAPFYIGTVYIPQTARLVRSAVISVRERDYVEATLTLAEAILNVAALSFLGFRVFTIYQYAIIFPGIAITLSVLSVNFIGDGLRDALDPRR